jgi:hypothetical protein
MFDFIRKFKPSEPAPEGDGFAFRMRLTMPDRRDISHNEKELRLTSAEDVRLVAAGDADKINGAKELLLIGRGYESHEAAEGAGRKWRSIFERSSALARIGVDFGERGHGGGLGGEYHQELERTLERPVIYNNYGLQVFKESPWPRFIRMDLGLSVGSPPDILTAATETARQLALTMPENEALAYDLFATSFFQKGPDARYLMLMASLEALIDPQPRPATAVAHVQSLIQLTRDADLPEDEILSILGPLKWLKSESIGEAGRRLMLRLGDRQYDDDSSVALFRRCYRLRSDLIHGKVPRPNQSDVESAAMHLEAMLGDLLSGELLEAVNIDAIVAARTQDHGVT